MNATLDDIHGLDNSLIAALESDLGLKVNRPFIFKISYGWWQNNDGQNII